MNGVACLFLCWTLAGCAETALTASANHVAGRAVTVFPAHEYPSRTSRLGPPSVRGLGLRRIDRAASIDFGARY